MKQLLYFSASWCAPCRAYKPLIESLQSEMSITFINVDSNPETASKFNVRSVPTVVILENDMEKHRLVGVKTKAEIISAYNG